MSHERHTKRKPSDTTASWTLPATETPTLGSAPSSAAPALAQQNSEAEPGTPEAIHSLHHFGSVSLFAPEPEAAPAAPPPGGDGGGFSGGGPLIQASLRINAPDDAFEQEADSVANLVMHSPASSDGLDTTPTEPIAATHVQRTSSEAAGLSASSAVESSISQMQSGGGSPIPATDRSFFEQRMGHDFSQIRIHTDSRAVQTSRDLNARAFTVGTDIAFDAGEYQPGTSSGRHLLAHELTHTIQQTGGIATKRIQREVADEELEEAIEEPEEVVAPENAAAEAIATFNPAEAEREREEPIEGEEATLAGEEADAVDASGGSEPDVAAPSGGAAAPAPEGAEAQAAAPQAGAPAAAQAPAIQAGTPDAKAATPGGALEQAQKAAQDALAVAQQGAAVTATQAKNGTAGTPEQASASEPAAAQNTTPQTDPAKAEAAKAEAAKGEAGAQPDGTNPEARAEGAQPGDPEAEAGKTDAKPGEVAKPETGAQPEDAQARDQRASQASPDAQTEPDDERERERPVVQRSARGPLFIQRKAGDGAPASAQEDPGFQAVVAQSQQAATQQKQHAPAEQKAEESAAAAKMPQEEKTGQAQDTQSASIEAAASSQAAQAQGGSAPGFDKAAFVASVRSRIDQLTPKDPKEMENIEGSGVFTGTKQVVDEKVQTGKQQAQGTVDDKVKEAPDPSRVADKPVTPLQPNAPGQQPAVDATGAAPKPKSEAAVEQPLQAESKQLDAQMEQAQVTPKMLQDSNEASFQQADVARTEAQAKVATDLPAYRSSEQGKIQGAQAEAHTAAEAGMQGMFGARAQQFGQLDGVQSTGQSKDEQKRAEIGRQIDGIYQSTKGEVESILSALDSQVEQAFSAGADQAKQAAVDYIKRETQAFKDKRYNKDADWWRVDQHVAGGLTQAWDTLTDMPPEYYEYYKQGRDLYIGQMDVVLGRVADIVGDHLTRAKARIAQGRTQIEEFIAKQPADLREVAQEIANDALGKFDELEQSVDAKQQELVDKLAEQYMSKLQELDSELEAMKEADKGFLAKARDLMTGVLDTIAQLKSMLESVLASAAGVITQIIQNPMQFLSNLLSGIGQGLRQFVGNIGTHLQKGLIEWLTGTLAGAGLQLPATWDLAGIFQLVLQIFGLTYAQIRQRIIQALGPMGEAVIGALEQAWEVFQIIQTEGLAGLWRFISSQVGDLQAMVMDEIKSLIANEVIKAGIDWLIGVLGGPAGAFIKAVQSIVRVVTWVMNNAGRMMSLVQAVVDGVGALASGNVGAMAAKVEQGLATAVPMAISFLAGLLGLGNLPARVQGIIQKVRKPIEAGIQWLVKQAKALGKKLLNKLAGKDKNKKQDGPDERSREDKERDLHQAIGQAERLMEAPNATVDSVKQGLPGIKEQYKLVSLNLVKVGDNDYVVEGQVNPKDRSTVHELGGVKLSEQEILQMVRSIARSIYNDQQTKDGQQQIVDNMEVTRDLSKKGEARKEAYVKKHGTEEGFQPDASKGDVYSNDTFTYTRPSTAGVPSTVRYLSERDARTRNSPDVILSNDTEEANRTKLLQGRGNAPLLVDEETNKGDNYPTIAKKMAELESKLLATAKSDDERALLRADMAVAFQTYTQGGKIPPMFAKKIAAAGMDPGSVFSETIDLMLIVESRRNKANMVVGPMMVDLIANGKMKWEDVPTKFPMGPVGAVKVADTINVEQEYSDLAILPGRKTISQGSKDYGNVDAAMDNELNIVIQWVADQAKNTTFKSKDELSEFIENSIRARFNMKSKKKESQ